MRVKYEDLLEKFQRILESRGFSGKHAKDAATVFANNSLDGVYSHGVNRFPRVVEYLDKGEIDSGAIATCESSMGAIERWNGHRGFGPLNAKLAMDRAVELAKEFAGRILGFQGGRVIFDGTPEELTPEELKRIYGKDIGKEKEGAGDEA